ncbi:MAG: hypothetical protein Q8K37_05540 [Alphaproteobacteria bacterium]|nr:hypothetical protein [Alphaproteobacteria bacterium]
MQPKSEYADKREYYRDLCRSEGRECPDVLEHTVNPFFMLMNISNPINYIYPNLTKIIFTGGFTDEKLIIFAKTIEANEGQYGLVHLNNFDMSFQELTDRGIKAIIDNFKGIVALNLEENPITYADALEIINNLPNLKYFSFDMDKMGGEQNQNTLRNLMAQKGIDVYHNYDYVG